MFDRLPCPPKPSPLRKRRRAFALLGVALCAAATAAAASGLTSPSSPESSGKPDRAEVAVTASGRHVLRMPVTREDGIDPRALQRRLAGRLPDFSLVSQRQARITYRYDLPETAQRARDLGAAGGTIEVSRAPVSSRIRATVVRQARANTCESAALQILLSADGRNVPQDRLQAALPTSGPLDPSGTGARRTWGDPDLGYVGRPDGGGPAGGFGVYPGPIARTAARFGRELDDLSGASVDQLFGRVLRGHAVMAWIGLSDGPYGQWRSPAGKIIRVNFGEHTVVLTGVTRDGRIRVANPLQGTSEWWTRARFESAWKLLGHRALGL